MTKFILFICSILFAVALANECVDVIDEKLCLPTNNCMWYESECVAVFDVYARRALRPTTRVTISPPNLSDRPTKKPTPKPGTRPTKRPTKRPVPGPSPTKRPTRRRPRRTKRPTRSPTMIPTTDSTGVNTTNAPSMSPTYNWTVAPSMSPTYNWTVAPSMSPTTVFVNTTVPTMAPTGGPIDNGTISPTGSPTMATFPPHTHDNDNDDGPLLTTGEIVGIVIGSLAVVLLSGVIGYLIGNNNS